MSIPRDHHAAHRIGLVRVARIFSNAVSPPTMFAVLGLIFALATLPFWQALFWAAVYGFWVSLAPILFILWLLRTGRIKELHMSDQRERHLPYTVAAVSAGIFLIIGLIFNIPELMICLAIFNVIELTLLGLINVKWLISIHATGMMATMTLVAYVFGIWSGLLVLPLVILVAAVRLYLKRHTVAQVIVGLALGFFSVWILTLFGCFVNHV
jgi:membrane-associated phospholipid phosphatase